MDAGIASTILLSDMAIIIAVVFKKEKCLPVTIFSIALAFVRISLLCKSPGGLQNLSLVGLLPSFIIPCLIPPVWRNRSSLKDMPIAKLTFYVLLFGLSVYVVRLKFCFPGTYGLSYTLVMGERSFTGCFSYCYFVGDHDKGHTLHWFHPHCYSGCFGACYSFILRSTDFWRAADTAHYSGHFDGDYCRNSDYRRKNIAEKKQDSVKAYWQIKSDFVSLPLQL